MDRMSFVLPCLENEQQALDYYQESIEYPTPTQVMAGLDRVLHSGGTYADWLQKFRIDLDIANPQPGRVPAFTYFYIRDDDQKIIGIINIRLALNDFLRTEGGHIGYSIRPSERGRGYGTAMLRETLKFIRVIGLDEVIITCGKANQASAGVIKKCGGQLDAELYSETFSGVIQRYVIRNC